jgi:hypothetical protein
MHRFVSRATCAAAMVLVAVVWIGALSAQPAKKVAFKKGQIQFKISGRSFAFPLSTNPDAGVLQTQLGAPGLALSLDYESSAGDEVLFSVINLSGPGRYEQKGNNQTFSVRAGGNVWAGQSQDCTFVFTSRASTGQESRARRPALRPEARSVYRHENHRLAGLIAPAGNGDGSPQHGRVKDHGATHKCAGCK